tara:strand:- start:182 stop:442 length:261 start_codon:yes stop_codon:yes gene_type:complete
MSHDGITISGNCAVTVTCTCGEVVTVIATANRGGSDYDEIKAIAYDEAGFSETGSCWACELSTAAEDAADGAMRDRKSNLEGSFAR